MERKLKKVPAFINIQRKWFACALLADMTAKQFSEALHYAGKYWAQEPAELPEDPAAKLLAAFIRYDIDAEYDLMEQGKFPFFYVDENCEIVGEVHNLTPETEKLFEQRRNFAEELDKMLDTIEVDSGE